MSAKGLPPAVRLDPLPLLPTCHSGHNPNILFAAAYPQKRNSPTPSMLSSPSPNSPQPQTQTPARGLTPIIITPESSSRPQTPAGSDRGTPGLNSMHTLTATGKQTKKLKFEFKLEPVELDPILPGGKVEVRAKAVSMDEDEGTAKLPQLPPTPCMTPVLHPVDLTEGGRGPGAEEPAGDRSPRTGRPILPARPDDRAEAAHHVRRSYLSLSDLADVAERERLGCGEEDVGRGRRRERRRSSRFREEKARYKPYDAGMRSIDHPIPSQLPSPSIMPARPASHRPAPDHPPPPPPPRPPAQPSALPPIAPPHPIPKAADHLVHLFNTELQNHIQAERDSLRSEYDHLIRERSEIQRERELMQRERAGHRPYGATNEERDRETRELREENRLLRIRVEELQARLESALRDGAPADVAMKPATPL